MYDRDLEIKRKLEKENPYESFTKEELIKLAKSEFHRLNTWPNNLIRALVDRLEGIEPTNNLSSLRGEIIRSGNIDGASAEKIIALLLNKGILELDGDFNIKTKGTR